MISSKSLITTACEKAEISQAELARRLGVSKVQVTKWKQGESMSMIQRSKILEIAGYADDVFCNSEEWAVFAETPGNAKAWHELFEYCLLNPGWVLGTGSGIYEAPPTDTTEHLVEELWYYNGYPWWIISALLEAGVEVPRKCPVLAFKVDEGGEDDIADPFILALIEIVNRDSCLTEFWLDADLKVDDDSLREASLNILSQTPGLAVASVEILTKLGATEEQARAYVDKTQHECRRDIRQLLWEMQVLKVPIYVDLYRLVDEDPGNIIPGGYFDGSIRDHMTLAERKTLDALDEIRAQLAALTQQK